MVRAFSLFSWCLISWSAAPSPWKKPQQVFSTLGGRSWEVGAFDSKIGRYIGGAAEHIYIYIHIYVYVCIYIYCMYSYIYPS